MGKIRREVKKRMADNVTIQTLSVSDITTKAGLSSREFH